MGKIYKRRTFYPNYLQEKHPAGQVPINKKKLENVENLIQYVVGYEDFYQTILSWPTSNAQINETSDYEED